MGQYLQLGLCYLLEMDKGTMDRLKVTPERVTEELSKDLDMSLFTMQESEEDLYFTIDESVVMQQLHDFLQFQYSLYPQYRSNDFDAALSEISSKSNFQDVVELAEDKRLVHFQYSRIYHRIQVTSWDSLPVHISLFVMFVEGKLYMECYDSFLKYLETQVRLSSKQWTLAGAFRAFIE